MKLLFDENLSFRLARELAYAYPQSAHVRDVGLLGAEDRRIWEHAAEHGFTLVSKDTDFYQRSVVHGNPPKVIRLRVGNAPTNVVVDILQSRLATVRSFHDDPNASFMLMEV